MERCTYLGKSLYANHVKLDFTEEQKIRKEGRERNLFCYECGKPVIYKRGEIRDAHFAHKEKSDSCEYEEYTKYCGKKSPSWKVVKEILYYQFSNQYPDAVIERDEKLFKGHYTDFYITLKNGNNIAIEIDDKTMTSTKLTQLCKNYTLLNINVDWVVLDTLNTFNFEHQSYYIKRARLNESVNHSVIVVDKYNYTFCIYKLDTHKYVYTNSLVEYKFRENVFSYSFDFEKLRISEQGLMVEGFDEIYQKWLDQRKREFDLKEFELTKRNNKTPSWDEDQYIDMINKIVMGEKHLIETIVNRLLIETNEMKIILNLYNHFKSIELVDNNYIDTFVAILEGINQKGE